MQDLWMARRDRVDEPFEKPVNLGPQVNTEDSEFAPSLSADGLSLFLQSRGDIWIASRETAHDEFGERVNLGPSVNSDTRDVDACLFADTQTLLFSSSRTGGQGRLDLWCTQRLARPGAPPSRSLTSESVASGEIDWSRPTTFGLTVNSPAIEAGPELSADGGELFFISDRSGGLGQSDIWCVRRLSSANGSPSSAAISPTDPSGWTWSEAINLGPNVNSSGGEKGPAISSDGRTLYFDSTREGGLGGSDLWYVRRVPRGE
jgi:hypothetical protein